MNRRFFCDDIPPSGESCILSGAEAHHVRTVLRGRTGEHIWLMDGRGTMAEAEIAGTGEGRRGPLTCRILTSLNYTQQLPLITLCVAPPRPKQMGLLVRQAVELGVAEVVPIVCEYGTSKPQSRAAEGWCQDATEACKQSGNPFLPPIHPVMEFAEALKRVPGAGYFGQVPRDPGEMPAYKAVQEAALSVWIGPEGGFSEAEQKALTERGYRPLQVGHWTLRVETAVVAVLATIQSRRAA